MVDGDGDRPSNCQRSHPRQQSSDQQPAANHLRERRDVREKDREGEMQGSNKCISKILDIGELLVTVVNEQSAGEDPQHKETEVTGDGTGKDGADH